MVIQHNITATNAWRQMGMNNRSINKNLENLASGFRINRAADDAAGLAISEKMRGQIRGMGIAEQNVDHGINLIKTAEGGMEEISNMLQRQRELIVQASNGTYSAFDREMLQKEIDQLTNAIDGIANSTHFNNIPLLNAGFSADSVNAANFVTKLTSLSTSPAPVNPDGSLNLNATNESGTNGSILIFGQGGTTHNKLQLTGGDSVATLDVRNDMTLVSTTYFDDTDPDGERWETVYSYQENGYDVELKQTLTIATPTSQTEFYHIEYEIANRDGSNNISASFLFNIDTQFTGADGTLHDDPRFSLDGTSNQITTGTIFEDSSIPSTVDLWHETNLNLNARIIVSGDDIRVQPDSLFIGGWPTTQTFAYTGGEHIGSDSEYSIVWENKAIAAGASLTLNTMYGVTDPMLNPELAALAGGSAIYIHNGANKNENVHVHRYDCRAGSLGLNSIVVSPIEEANRSLVDLDKAINTVSKYRANCGAQQNRLEHSLNNLGVSKENLQSAESSIRDADMAKEMMYFTKNNILVQAAQSMLAQANQIPQGVLSMLQ